MELGNVYLDTGETAKAESALTLAVGLLTKSGDLARLAQAHVCLGRLRTAQRNRKDAEGHYRTVADCYLQAGMKDEAERALSLIPKTADSVPCQNRSLTRGKPQILDIHGLPQLSSSTVIGGMSEGRGEGKKSDAVAS